ncbi:MAG: hypothetical protein JRE24_04325 [Deltaproteobacteria bacterium]|nr:hypothetical protein [Deltaproteobacteria bacterium]
MAKSTRKHKYLTQEELAKRWRMSESCVKNWRVRGLVPYLRFPGSSRVIYPLHGIQEVENVLTEPAREVMPEEIRAEIKRKKPVVSSKDEDWRI